MKFKSWAFLLVLALAVIVTRAQAATTWHVAPGGSDSNDCLTLGTACATINGAIGKAANGDIIQVAAGTYTAAVTINKEVTLQGPNAGIAGTGARGAEAVISNAQITTSGAGPVVIDGFHVYQTNNTSDAVLLAGATNATVQNSIIDRDGITTGNIVRGITTSGGAGVKLIQNNLFTGDTSGGLFGGHKTWNSGMYVNGASSTVTIQNNRFENTRTALNLDDFNAGITVVGNTFANNGTHLAFGGTTPTNGQFVLGANEFGTPGSAFVNLSNVATTFRLDITSSTFGGTLGQNLTLGDQFLVEFGMFHRGRSGRNGLVTYVPATQFVITANPSIQSAVGMAVSGHTIMVANGTYSQTVTIDKSLTLGGQSEAGTVLDGTSTVSGRGIFINSNVTDVTIENLTVQDFLNASGSGIYANGGNNNFTVQNVTVTNNGVVGGSAGGVYMNGPVNNVLIDNVTAHSNRTRGIVIWNGFKTNITITNNDVQLNNCCGIELSDGTASGVTITGNTIMNNADNGIGVVGLTSGAGPNVIANNTLMNNGRFGIELKVPNGTGLESGDGSIVVSGNGITMTAPIADMRDMAGIAAFRRAWVAGNNNVDIPAGVVIKNNTVSGYMQASSSDGFGIVVEGNKMNVYGNTVTNSDVGIQRQKGHLPYTPNTNVDGDQSNLADMYFGRGNSPVVCAQIGSNTFSGNGTNSRDVGAGIIDPPVVNTNTGIGFCTIQSAIADSTTLAGHTLTVAAGTYAEDVVVSKPLTLLGPNAAINPNTGVRVAEAIITAAATAPDPTTNCTVPVYIQVSNVTVRGFTVDGDNPSLSGGFMVNGVDVDACEGIASYEGVGNIVVENNIFENYTYSAMDFYNYTSDAATSGNYIRYNLIENVDSTTGFGIGTLVYNNFYADITDNVYNNVRVGIQTGNFYRANVGATGQISNNELNVWRAGLFHNLWYSNASSIPVTNNTINAISRTDTKWNGILLSSFSSPANTVIQNNIINIGNILQTVAAGYNVWNIAPAVGMVISGGTVDGGDYGVFVNNYDGYASNANNTGVTVNGLTINNAELAGVYIKDNPSNTNGATVSATITDTIINSPATSVGILMTGSDASGVANYNQLLGNNGIDNQTGASPDMDGTYNWWGNPSGPSGVGPGIGSSVSIDVDFSPWCLNSACTTFSDPGNLIIPSGSDTATAQAIIDSASSGQTVTYEGGPYPGGIVVTNPGITIFLNGSTIGAGSPAYTIAAADVTVLGPGVLDGNHTDPAVLVVAGGNNFTLQNVEVRNWEDGVEVSANVTSFKLFDNWIHTNDDAGLQVDAGVTIGGVVSIQGNLFKENGGNGIQHNGTGTLPATYNSWGHLAGPASGDGVSANVTFAPFTFIELYMDVDPDTNAILRNVVEDETFDVALKAEAENVYGLTFSVTYDIDLITLNSTTFVAPWAGRCTSVVPAPPAGTLAYICNLLGEPEWDGGTIATLNFTADLPTILPADDGPWSAIFDIAHAEANTSAGAVNGAKVFVNNAGFGAPSAAARDITDTNDGEIVIAGLANFTGFVDLQGRANDSGAVLQVYNQALKAGSIVLANATSAAGGGYTTTYIPPYMLAVGSTYYFQVDRALFLPSTAVATTVLPMPPVPNSWQHSANMTDRPLTTLNTIVLLGGDATNDDYIDIGDASCIGGQYGMTPAACGVGGTGDVNGDSAVNILDLTLMGGNFNKNSSPWIPQ